MVGSERVNGRGRRAGWTRRDRLDPDFDESLEGIIRDEVFVMQHLHGGGAGVVAAV